MNDPLDVHAFDQVRREAARWCEVAAPDCQLRTPALRPVLSAMLTSEELTAALEELIGKRRKLLDPWGPTTFPDGRLIVCEMNEAISSGESEAVTSGFFDVDDRPPWDTWIWTIPRSNESGQATLISWVPQRLEGIVTRGIEVNRYGCIYWLSDAPNVVAMSPLMRALFAAGIR